MRIRSDFEELGRSSMSDSTVSPERDSVSSEPALLLRGSDLLGLVTSGLESSVLLASSSETS